MNVYGCFMPLIASIDITLSCPIGYCGFQSDYSLAGCCSQYYTSDGEYQLTGCLFQTDCYDATQLATLDQDVLQDSYILKWSVHLARWNASTRSGLITCE